MKGEFDERPNGRVVLRDSCRALALCIGAGAPEGTDSGVLVKGLKSQFAAIVTDGQGEMKGQLFRIAHIGYFDYMDTIAILGALEQVIHKTKTPLPSFEFGKGLIAAQNYFANHAK